MFSCFKRTFLTRKPVPPVVCSNAQEAVLNIPNGSRVFLPSIASSSSTMMTALSTLDGHLNDIELVSLHLEKPNPCEKLDSFYPNHLFVGPLSRKNVEQGNGSYIPVFLREAPKLLRNGLLTPDVAIVNVSPPDKHGYCSLGVEVAVSYPAAQSAKMVIAQINKFMPRTHGYGSIHISAFDYVVYADEPLADSTPKSPSDLDMQIGKHIASLIPNGSTLQTGIGLIPNAILKQLINHRDLGIHTEMFSDGVIDLIEKGVVNNRYKKFLPDKTVTSFVVGSQKLYDFVDDNTNIFFADSSIVNDVHIIGSNPRVAAINCAIEVDITGQVCADSVGTRQISGVGGQIDFESGAAISPGGIPIICLRSVTKNGDSTIVSALKPGAGVTTTRPHVHYIVTEHGIAQLFGKNFVQRAKALIDIAHPSHREQLEKEAFERYKAKTWRV